jgi:hypothetical protein
MRDFVKFQWLCAKDAWRGCWTSANEIGAVLGGGILALLLFVLRNWLRAMNWVDAPTTVWGTAAFGVALAAGSVALSFFILLLGRLILAPSRLYWKKDKETNDLEITIASLNSSGTDELDIYPNVRAADNEALIKLLTAPSIERNKLLALLSEGRIRSWCRSNGQQDLGKIEPHLWFGLKFDFIPASSPDRISQTFIAFPGNPSAGRPWSQSHTPYDLWLNFAELKRFFPDLTISKALKETR